MTTVSTADIELHVPTSPYKGLVPYAADDAPFFFGRDEWCDIVIDNLRAYRLTLLYGASGIGKSSVLHAGVLHDLRARAQRAAAETGSPGLAVVVFRSWRDDPLGALVASVQAAADDVLGERTPVDPDASHDLSAALEECIRRVGGKVFVVLDQFEEYFLYHGREDDGDEFADAFVEAVNRRELRATFLISIREDAIAKLDRFKGRLPSLFDNYLRIEQLGRDEAREAIEKPLQEYARRAGRSVTIEPALVEAVLDEVQTGKVLVGQAGAGVVDPEARHEGRIETPYLQLVLTRLWDEEMRHGSDALRLETFERLGGAEGIVRTHLDAAMSALPAADQDTAAQLFNHLVTPSGSKIAQSVSDLATYAELPDAESVTAILERLSGEVRILRPVGEASYEIYHDALAAPILDWRARRQREQQRRRERRRIRLYAGIALISAIVAVIVTVLAVSARQAEQQAEDRGKQIERTASQDLAENALARLQNAPEQASELALKAYRRARTPSAVTALRTVVSRPSLSSVLSGRGAVRGATFSPNGRLVATTGTEGDTRVWEVTTGRHVTTLEGHSRGVVSNRKLPLRAVFSPDGGSLVTVGNDGATRIWETSTWRLTKTLRGHRAGVLHAAFSGNGRRLVTAAADGRATVHEVSSWRTIAEVRARTKRPVKSAALSPDGAKVALTERDGSVSVWRVATERPIPLPRDLQKRSAKFAFVVHVSVAFSSDGRLLLAAGEDGRARLWDVARRRHIKTVSDKLGAINAASFSPDGARFVTAGDDGNAVIRRTTDGKKVAKMNLGDEVATAAFSPDGLRIIAATTGFEGNPTASVWDPARPSRPAAVLVARGKPVVTWVGAFSPDGSHIVTAGDDRNARLWAMGVDRAVISLPRQTKRIDDMEYSPDGKVIVTSGENGVRVWGTVDGRSVAVLHPPGGRDARGEGFSRDGKRFATSGAAGATVWDTRGWRKLAQPGKGRARLSPDGRLLATLEVAASADKSRAPTPALAPPNVRAKLRLWNATTGSALGAVSLDELHESAFAEFSPDGKLILVDGIRALNILRVPDLRRTGFPIKNTGEQRVAIYSPDGRFLAARQDDDTRLSVWNVATGKRVAIRTDGVSATFSPDSRVVAIRAWGLPAAGGPPSEKRTEVWDLAARKRLSLARGFINGWRPGEAFNDRGQFLVNERPRPVNERPKAGDLTRSIGESSTGRVFARIPGVVHTATFSPTEARIAASHDDGVVRIYSCVACGSDERIFELVERRWKRAVGAQRKPK